MWAIVDLCSTGASAAESHALPPAVWSALMPDLLIYAETLIEAARAAGKREAEE
jgi:hypothetical protein